MMTYGFKNYEEFKELFAMKTNDNGVSYRRNKILLAFLKSKSIHEYARTYDRMDLLQITDMSTLYNRLNDIIYDDCYRIRGYSVRIMDRAYVSSVYKTDDRCGVCEDMDYTSIRYINTERDNKVYKMKIGKMFKSIILGTEFGKYIPESTMLWMCEEITRKWEAYSMSRVPRYTLHVDDDFAKIYDADGDCYGSFGSCMQGDENYHFYESAVKAKAAYLTRNEDDKVIARCILWTDVTDEDGNKWRLAERQYTTDGNEALKRALVYALIQGGYIDGYKKVGVDCHANTAFEDIHEESLSHKTFRIDCDLDYGDYLSYQDSFVFYDMDDRVAYNRDECGCNYNLDTTEERFEDDRNYDEYHNEYTTSSTVDVHYGIWMSCSEDELDDFIFVDNNGHNDYYHYSEVTTCARCGENVLMEDDYYSEITDESYCCDYCRDYAEQAFKERYWYYSEYDSDYYENDEDVVIYNVWNRWCNNYYESTISRQSLDVLISNGEVVERDGEFYDCPEHIADAA